MKKNHLFKRNFVLVLSIFILLILVDVMDLSGKINYLSELNNHLQNSSYFSKNLLLIIVSLLSILYALYFIIIQIFRNRYPLEIIKNMGMSI